MAALAPTGTVPLGEGDGAPPSVSALAAHEADTTTHGASTALVEVADLPYLNVKDAPYNAVLDDATDDTVAIQAAIDAAAAAGGGTVVVSGKAAFTRIIAKSNVTLQGVNPGISGLRCTLATAGSAITRADDGADVFRFGMRDIALVSAYSGVAASEDTFAAVYGLNLCGMSLGHFQNVAIEGFGMGGIILARAEAGTEGLGFAGTTKDGNHNKFYNVRLNSNGNSNADVAQVWFKYKANSNKFYGVQVASGDGNAIVIAYGDDNLISGAACESQLRAVWFKDRAANNVVTSIRAEGIATAIIKADASLTRSVPNLVLGIHQSTSPTYFDVATDADLIVLAGAHSIFRGGPIGTTTATQKYNLLDSLGMVAGSDGLLYFTHPTRNTDVPILLRLHNTLQAAVNGSIMGGLEARTNDTSGGAAGVNARLLAVAKDSVGTLAWELWTGTGDAPTKKVEVGTDTVLISGRLRFTSTTGPSWHTGTATPEGAVTAAIGSLFTRTDGGAATTLYVKESGSGNVGWIAK